MPSPMARMQVRILFFGMLKDLVGMGSQTLNLPEGAKLSSVLEHYERQIPGMKRFVPALALAVNKEYAGPEAELHSDDEIALLPPVSGGSGPLIFIVCGKIDTNNVLQQIKRPEDGAAVVFEGVVRNHSRGRRTLYLDYEAYEPMALKQMKEIVGEALARFQVRDIALVHRLDRLEIGETSVMIVVAAAHRSAAFEACRWLIDTLKRTVPIWKKEYFEDGAVWADGEPFPAEIPRLEGTPAGKPASK